MKTINGQQSHQTSAIGASINQISAHIGTRKMNDEMFVRLVAEDVKNRASETQQEYLHLVENRERWKRALISLVNNLDEQIKSLNDDKELDIERYSSFGEEGKVLLVEATASYDARLSKIERFKFYVNKRLDYVAGLGEDTSMASRVEFLEAAINKHKELMEQFDLESTEIDFALWSSLDGNWMFDDIKSLE